MNINSPINKADPSTVVVEQILERSEYWNCMSDSMASMKEKIDHAEDEESRLALSSELKLLMSRLIKLKEYTEYIHETFRTIPFKSERLLQAEEYFYDGKFQEMNGVLDAEKIHEEIESLEEDRFSEDEDLKGKARASLEYKSYELVVKALYAYTLIENPKWYEDVFNFLEEAESVSFNVHAMYEFGSYLSITDEQEWALERLDDAYVVSRDTEGEAYRLYEAKCLWKLGIMSGKKGDWTAAIEYAGKALKIYTALSEDNPAEYRPKMSEMFVITGEYNVYAENFPVALILFEEAVKIREELLVYEDSESAMQLAYVLDLLANVHSSMKEFDEAISIYEEILKIREDNIEYNLYSILESNANTLYNMAGTYYSMHEYEKSIRRVREELDVRKRIQEVDFLGQLPYIVSAGKLLVDQYLNLNRPEDAIRELEEIVVNAYRTLVKHFPDRYLPDLADALIHCTGIYFHIKSDSGYLQSTMETLEIFRKLAAVNPDEYLSGVGILLGNVSFYYEEMSPDREKALEAARESYQILSSVERNENAEKAYAKIVQIMSDERE